MLIEPYQLVEQRGADNEVRCYRTEVNRVPVVVRPQRRQGFDLYVADDFIGRFTTVRKACERAGEVILL